MSDNQRTNSQNKAMHKFFKDVALYLNEHGIDQKMVYQNHVDIPWTADGLKIFWKRVQKYSVGTDSTAELTTSQVSEVLDVVQKTIAERTGHYVDFPSAETLMKQLEDNQH